MCDFKAHHLSLYFYQLTIFSMKKYILLLITLISLTIPSLLSAQGAICAEMQPFCSDSGASFPASTNTSAEPGNQYGCLVSQPNPAWYYFQIDNPGYLEITMSNSNNVDTDFIAYGPYADLPTAIANCGSFQTQETSCPVDGICPNSTPCNLFNGCVDGDGVDCSFDPQSVEVADIPNAQTGEVYVFLITNFSGLPTEIFLNKTAGEATTNCSIVEECTNSGGQLVGPTSVELCADDPPFILETMNEVTDATMGLPDILWGVWVLDDPLAVTTIPGGGPLPNDQLPSDDPNYIGALNNGPGQIIFGTSINLIPDGSGVTYYIAPFVGDGSLGLFDADCTGLDPAQGYTIYMNPPLNANVGVNTCDIQVDLTGGFPTVDNTADYAWSYTTPDGQMITGTGTPINVVGGADGDYTFSITNDGSNCDLLSFAIVTLLGCDCSTSTTTMPCDDGDSCTINDVETVSDSNGLVCVPCAGTPVDCDSGESTIQSCNDGNPDTENDMETVLNCDGSVCIPCEGTPIMNQCNITSLGLEIFCDDNGTVDISSDDTFTFTVNPIGNNLGTSYTISGTVNVIGVSYGTPSIDLGPFDAGTLVNVTITDDSDTDCQLNEQVFSDCFNEIVPTLSQWGLIILALILLNFGVLYIRQNELKPVKQAA